MTDGDALDHGSWPDGAASVGEGHQERGQCGDAGYERPGHGFGECVVLSKAWPTLL